LYQKIYRHMSLKRRNKMVQIKIGTVKLAKALINNIVLLLVNNNE